MHLILSRLTTYNNAVLGRLDGLSKTLWTVEDEWRDNQRGISCIPLGEYRVVPHGWEPVNPFKFKQTWQVTDVPKRTGILFHAGNSFNDTEGCILVGLGALITQKQTVTADSRAAISFMRQEIGQNGFTLTIK